LAVGLTAAAARSTRTLISAMTVAKCASSGRADGLALALAAAVTG
jgi:hypothetical protein